MNKIFAIGDIHGCMGKLRTLIQNINADPENDIIVFIGDYIDRGSAAREVVDYVIGLTAEYKNVVCLLGNHEYMFLRYLDGLDEEMYLSNGGSVTLFAYAVSLSETPQERKAKIPREHLKFFESLLPHYETDNYLFVHAGLKPGLILSRQTIHDLLWVRHEFIDTDYDFGKMIVFGHTPLSYPLIMPNKIGIDTGAAFGGKLTCVELPAVKIYQV
jgi:serine/threonine protein phosphatase 1